MKDSTQNSGTVFNMKADDGRLSRVALLRSIPLSGEERDVITALEGDIVVKLPFPPVELLLPGSTHIADSELQSINTSAFYSTIAVELVLMLLSREWNSINKDDVNRGIQIYTAEFQRHCGSLFPLNHDFWPLFYQASESLRSTNWDKMRHELELRPVAANRFAKFNLSLYMLPLEVVNFKTGSKDQFIYELLRQSLASLLGAYLLTALNEQVSIIRQQLDNASRLSARLKVQAYTDWLGKVSAQILQNHML